MSSLEFEKIIDLPRKCMRVTGVWPESKQKINSKLKVFVTFFIITFFLIIPQTTKLVYVKNNLYDVVNIMLIGLTIAVISALKLFHQWHMVEGKTTVYSFEDREIIIIKSVTSFVDKNDNFFYSILNFKDIFAKIS